MIDRVKFYSLLRRRNRAQNTSKEDRKEARTYNNAINGIERPENVDPSKQHLPDNPLYHSYQENKGKEDSKNEKDEVGTLPLQDSNAVYAQPNKLTRSSNVNQDDYNESQNENVYAQVNKTKKT